jgi:hypothetical protein
VDYWTISFIWRLSLHGVNNVFVTPQLWQERYIRFVIATGVSQGSYSKSSEFFYQCRVKVTGGSLEEIHTWQKSLGSQRQDLTLKSSCLRWLLHTAHSICKVDSDGPGMKSSGCVLMKRFRTSGHARKQTGSLCTRLIEAFRLVYKWIVLCDDDDQWRYSPDRALASLPVFMIVCSTMWGYQLRDRPVLHTLIQP